MLQKLYKYECYLQHVIYIQTTIENGCLTEESFFNACLWREEKTEKHEKTKFTKKLLKSILIAPSPERIVWCYAKHQQDLFEELMKMNLEHVEGKYFKKKKNLIILDDLIDETLKKFKVTQLFTSGCHNSLSVIYLTQNLFPKNQRALSLNSSYMVIFKNPQDNSQFATIARQIRPET